jgi:hypothetical protein
MAEYKDHLNQVNSNLKFLGSVNAQCNQFIDWQVTTCFYVGVHLVNAFLAKEANAHFNSHERVKDAISPDSTLQATKLDNNTYLAYVKLRNLSRRSRYLCNGDNPELSIDRAHFTREKHFLKAFRYLDTLLRYFYSKYNDPYPVTSISYSFELETPNCVYFTFTKNKTEDKLQKAV